ncbi:ComEA family DNA-binding protein [Thalassotalea sp. PLHSN55]|uniref:ComEA family DNA-binding protein n=1 Tax=Thalassotalea sp. PLHSN55 TaxID=3435888 RepID=UPI003F840F12
MKKLLLVLLSTSMLLTGFTVTAETPVDKSSQAVAHASAPVNINLASEQELLTLKGIGKTKAQAIINYRNEKGRFTKVEDLLEVNGIGKKVIKANSDRLSV